MGHDRGHHGHKHALEDMRKILRTGNPGIQITPDSIAGDMQPATCWTCKGPDVPRMMRELSASKSVMDPANFYAKKWSELGAEEVNPIGCSDCHDARTMDLRPARPALYEAFARRGLNVKNATHFCPSGPEREKCHATGDALAGVCPMPCGVLLHQA